MTTCVENEEKLKQLLMEVFLLDEDEYTDEKSYEEIEGWDSLATVSMAVAIHQEFGHHMTPQEATSINTLGDIRHYLRNKGVEV
ncbi:acyl carrier protein [Simkania negevensis]|uniref:Acyl carrier protein n=1 Tax=Simkania negevensis TaxID=83561 RepID=A0ABS3ARY0_9BACT|nr:acyl carrier protein [Simkania negevensis]